MSWILFPNGQLTEIPDPFNSHRLGDEISMAEVTRLTPAPTAASTAAGDAHRPKGMPRADLQSIRTSLAGDLRPGILVSRKDEADATDQIQELVRNVKTTASRMRPAADFPRFQRHYNDHRELLETITGNTYPHLGSMDRTLIDQFLRDLGNLITAGRLALLGAATVNKTENLLYIFRGAGLTTLMAPDGRWVTLLREGTGLDRGLMFHMRFDKPHPFAYAGYGKTGA